MPRKRPSVQDERQIKPHSHPEAALFWIRRTRANVSLLPRIIGHGLLPEHPRDTQALGGLGHDQCIGPGPQTDVALFQMLRYPDEILHLPIERVVGVERGASFPVSKG